MLQRLIANNLLRCLPCYSALNLLIFSASISGAAFALMKLRNGAYESPCFIFVQVRDHTVKARGAKRYHQRGNTRRYLHGLERASCLSTDKPISSKVNTHLVRAKM